MVSGFREELAKKLHKITLNSIQNRGSTSILTNLVGVHQIYIYSKFEAKLFSSLREEVKNANNVHDNNKDGGHRVSTRVTFTH